MNFSPQPKPQKTKSPDRVAVWNRIRMSVLKPMFKKLNITYCEVSKYLYSQGMITDKQAQDRNFNLSFHHRHKRDWYKQFGREKEEQLLGDFSQVILVGDYYHNMLENNKELSDKWFLALRGEEVV
jgi:hypothetical protein